MVKRAVGAILIVAGAILLYAFVAGSMFHGRADLGEEFRASLPFAALGKNYPADALTCAGAFVALFLGLCGVLAPAPAPRPAAAPAGSAAARLAAGAGPRGGGRIAAIMMLNSLLLVASLFVTFVGAKAKYEDTGLVYAFAATGLVQAALGLILLLLAILEKPKGPASLFFGTVFYLGGVGLLLAGLLGGGA
jgi:hypothetical protein